MALDFSVLQGMDPAGAFFRGQEAVRAEQDRNMLRQQQAEQMQFQRENMLAQREQRLAMASEREAAAQERAARVARQREADEYLTKVSDLFAQNNMPLTPETAQQGLAFALRSGDKNAVEMMSKTVQAMQERASYEQERQRLGLGAPGAAVGREQVQNMLMSSNPQIVTQGKALAGMLEKPRASQLLTPEEEAQKTRIALASRPPAQPKSPGAPVPVIDPDTNKTIFVSSEEALRRRMTPASANEGLSPKEIQKREASYPKTTAALRSFETQADTLVKNLTKLRDHPGLSGITGLIFGITPAITPEARSAKADLENILARGSFAELAAMRQASPTGGALGNISNQEVKYLRDAFGALNTQQDTETFKQKINDVIDQLNLSKRNVREEYDNTYEYRTSRGSAPAAPPGLSSEDKQALDWANKNPKDPRAAQIKQRLGM